VVRWWPEQKAEIAPIVNYWWCCCPDGVFKKCIRILPYTTRICHLNIQQLQYLLACLALVCIVTYSMHVKQQDFEKQRFFKYTYVYWFGPANSSFESNTFYYTTDIILPLKSSLIFPIFFRLPYFIPVAFISLLHLISNSDSPILF
jgi:hypothetical protein